MLRLDKVIKPWKESAALNDHINLYGFWNETAFLTKSGDLGMVLSVPGVDYESLDRSEQEYAVKRLEAALKAFGPGFHVYQYLFKSNRPDIPFATYDDPIVEAAIDQRRKFFEAKRDHLYQVEIFYCILLEGARSKTGVGAALARLLRDPEGAIGELKAQFTNDSMKTLLRTQIERDLRRLDQQRAGIRSAARGLHANRDLESAGTIHVLPPLAELRRLAYCRQAAVHAVSRLSGGQLRHRSGTRSSARRRSHRPCADDERGHHRDAAPGARRAAEDSGQLLCRHGVDAAPRGQGPQRSEQAPPPLQYVEDGIRLADGQRRHEDEPARCAGGRVQAGRHRKSWRLPARPG